jgi:hypothetical protein
MRRTKLHTAWLLALLFFAKFSFAQSSVTVNAAVDKSEILIGQRIQLSLDVKISLGFNPSWFPLDSIPHFEFIEKGKIDSVVTENDKSYHQNIIITSFDSGMHVIPQMPIMIDGKNFLTDSIPITVKMTPADPKQDYHDIKDILDVQNPYSKYIVWAIVAITVISIALVVYFFTRKQKEKTKEEEQIVSRLTAYDEAIKSLEELRKQEFPAKGQVKLYYSRLNDILRLFVLRKLQIASLTKTNEELIMQLKELNISREQFSNLAQSLRMSDFVKFAKYLPDENDNEENFKVIKSSVEILNVIDK